MKFISSAQTPPGRLKKIILKCNFIGSINIYAGLIIINLKANLET